MDFFPESLRPKPNLFNETHDIKFAYLLLFVVACDQCNAICFTLFMITSIHNIRKYTKIRNWKKRWKVTQKIQGSKDKDKSLNENKKCVQQKKLIDTQGESNINTVPEELLLSLIPSTFSQQPIEGYIYIEIYRSIEIYKLNDLLCNKQKLSRSKHSYSSLVFHHKRSL